MKELIDNTVRISNKERDCTDLYAMSFVFGEQVINSSECKNIVTPNDLSIGQSFSDSTGEKWRKLHLDGEYTVFQLEGIKYIGMPFCEQIKRVTSDNRPKFISEELWSKVVVRKYCDYYEEFDRNKGKDISSKCFILSLDDVASDGNCSEVDKNVYFDSESDCELNYNLRTFSEKGFDTGVPEYDQSEEYIWYVTYEGGLLRDGEICSNAQRGASIGLSLLNSEDISSFI